MSSFLFILLGLVSLVLIYELVKMRAPRAGFDLVKKVFQQWAWPEVVLLGVISGLAFVLLLIVFWQGLVSFLALKFYLHLWSDHYEKEKA